MSKRFGRNQRRRAREALAVAQKEIDNLQAAMRMDRALLALQGKQLRAAEDFAREVAEIVGREAVIAGQPVTLKYEWTRKDRISQFQHAPHMPLPRLMLPSYAAPLDMLRSETMHLLQVDAVADMLRHQMIFEARLADGHQAIAVSGTALRRMTEQELYRKVAVPLTTALLRQLKGRQG